MRRWRTSCCVHRVHSLQHALRRLLRPAVLATGALLVVACAAPTDDDLEFSEAAITAERKALLDALLVVEGSRSPPTPFVEQKLEDSVQRSLYLKVKVELPKLKIAPVKLTAEGEVEAKVDYETFANLTWRIHGRDDQEHNDIYRTVKDVNGNPSTTFNVARIKEQKRKHSIYCEVGAKLKQGASVSLAAGADAWLVSVEAGGELKVSKEVDYSQYSGGFDLDRVPLGKDNAPPPMSWFQSICTSFREQMDPIIANSFKANLSEQLRRAVTLNPAEGACTVPANRTAATSDEECNFIFSADRILYGASLVGRCVSQSSAVPFGRCERRTREGSPCNLYRKADGSLAKPSDEGARTLFVQHPACDESQGLTCQVADSESWAHIFSAEGILWRATVQGAVSSAATQLYTGACRR